MATDPTEILRRCNAEVAQIRGYADLTDEAKERRIAEVSERAQAEYAEAREAEERERAERLERTKAAVFRVPTGNVPSDAEAAQIYAAFRGAWSDVLFATANPESPQQVGDKLEQILNQAERTGDTLLARAAYHRAIDLGVQPIVDSYLEGRPKEAQAWQRYTEAYQEASQSRDVLNVLGRGLTERAFSSGASG
jgi:predicted metal-dependent phosphoesterase TrpH